MTPADGIFSEPKNRLRDTLAACYWFRNWSGKTESVSEAKRRIYLDGLPAPAGNAPYTPAQMNSLRPFAIIYTTALRMVANSTPGGFYSEGSFTIELEQNIPTNIASDPTEVDRVFDNRVGSIVFTGSLAKPGLWDLAARAHQGYFEIQELYKDGPHRTPHEEVQSIGDASIYYLHLTWGVGVR